MKIRFNILSLFLLCALLVSCGTSRQGGKKQRKGMKTQVMLTPEQQRKYDYFFLEASRLKMQNDYGAAFDLLQHCLSINPNASSALYEISQYYMFLKQVPQGQAALEKAVENDPDNYWYSQGLANLYQQQDEKEKAMKLLEDMSIRFTDKLDPLYALLDIYNRQEQYDKVIATLNRIEEKMGKSEQLSMEKFRIYLQMKDNKNAFHEIESLVAEYPMDSRYQVVLGDVYMQNGKKEEAYNMYRKVLDAEPDNAMAMYSLASYYEETGQKDLYQQQLDTLLLNKKVPSETKLNVMRQFVVQNEQDGKDSTRVISLFDRILEQEPDDAVNTFRTFKLPCHAGRHIDTCVPVSFHKQFAIRKGIQQPGSGIARRTGFRPTVVHLGGYNPIVAGFIGGSKACIQPKERNDYHIRTQCRQTCPPEQTVKHVSPQPPCSFLLVPAATEIHIQHPAPHADNEQNRSDNRIQTLIAAR